MFKENLLIIERLRLIELFLESTERKIKYAVVMATFE